ncbi:MASE1 domain-containing protein [Pseudanabaena sp. FACHB-1998]|uniref:MASE1 domain-containing protein n=1 Tax=Pseudanabaena sp. FACHB-1998 TaxID=2692858 RepID=UPI001680D919|nr:MASE1 domain-containing protein [Pseudanabaena sp. FACHB-1998]MBD2178720.1 MASE1 domain-containing protein [Pseudanabaena sp. FACHB-1998]
MFVLSQQRLKSFPRIVAIAILALIYYGTAELSRHIASTPQSVTPVWPPDGFASAAILIFGIQILPGVLIGSFLANIWAFFNSDNLYTAIASCLQVLGIAIGTSMGAWLGSYLLRKSIKGRNPLLKLAHVYRFLALTGFLAPTINATVGVLCLCLGGNLFWAKFPSVWVTWWISNVAGICIFTPMLLSLYEFYKQRIDNQKFLSKTERQKIQIVILQKFPEAIALLLIVVWISISSFYQSLNLEYILIPCLFWAIIRFGQLWATTLIVVMTTIAVSGTVKGLGAFTSFDASYSLILLQIFIIVIVVTTLSLGAVLSEKQQAIANLLHSRSRLIDKSIQLENSRSSLDRTTLMLEQQNVELTESKKIAEAASRTKTEFLSNMSHELRTPLNAILGLVQLLQDSKNMDIQEKKDIQTIYDSGNHLLNLIEDILDISKIEAGKMELYIQEISLVLFLNNLVKIIQVQANQKNIDFLYHFSSDLPPLIRVDGKRLRQILLNLLSNAVKFTNKGYVIFRVSCYQSAIADVVLSNSSITLNFEVEDSGIGLETEQLEAIFLPFEQVGESKFQVQGTGLGLAISQKIAKMMDSKITVTSKKGVGTTFRLSLLLEVPDLQSFPSFHTYQSSKSREKSIFDEDLARKLPLNILLAEDNIVNQKVACKMLSRLGYTVDIAENGLKVLEALHRQFYDVVLMDVHMPMMDGLETTRHIVSEIDVPKRPYIIAMTANAMESDRLACLASGMNDYLSKPVKVDLLIAALWRSQRHHPQERQE